MLIERTASRTLIRIGQRLRRQGAGAAGQPLAPSDLEARRNAIDDAIATLTERPDLSPALKERGVQALQRAKSRLDGSPLR